MAHQSDSATQQQAEPLIREKVAEYIGKPLMAATVKLASGAPVQVDGVAADESVFVEIFAHQGPLKGGQRHKVATDALKLITLGRSRPQAQLILAFGDPAAAAFATKGTWMSEALTSWKITVLVVELGADIREGICAAQARQVMINPSAEPPAGASLE
ncbi:MAG: hypothetical protein WAU75_18010 [Solirubrobacteraceae bacterium]